MMLQGLAALFVHKAASRYYVTYTRSLILAQDGLEAVPLIMEACTWLNV
jgi:hypothetical protein